MGHTIQLYSLRRKQENTVTWLNITWYKELSIDNHENNVQNTWLAHVGTGQNWLETMDIGRKERKKDEIWYYSQVAKVRLLTEFGSFPTDSQQTIITDLSRGTGMCLNIIFNLYIACVKYMCINSGIYSRV